MAVLRYSPTGHTLAERDEDRCEITTFGHREDDPPVRCLLKRGHDPETGHLGDTRAKIRFRWWPEEDG